MADRVHGDPPSAPSQRRARASVIPLSPAPAPCTPSGTPRNPPTERESRGQEQRGAAPFPLSHCRAMREAPRVLQALLLAIVATRGQITETCDGPVAAPAADAPCAAYQDVVIAYGAHQNEAHEDDELKAFLLRLVGAYDLSASPNGPRIGLAPGSATAGVEERFDWTDVGGNDLTSDLTSDAASLNGKINGFTSSGDPCGSCSIEVAMNMLAGARTGVRKVILYVSDDVSVSGTQPTHTRKACCSRASRECLLFARTDCGGWLARLDRRGRAREAGWHSSDCRRLPRNCRHFPARLFQRRD